MYSKDNGTASISVTQSGPPVPDTVLAGILWSALGVLAFSFTLPVTRLAIHELDAFALGLGRAAIAALLAASVVLIRRDPLPARRHVMPLAWAAFGTVLAFPLLTSLALQSVPAHHAVLVVGLTPLTTAAVASLRAQKPQGLRFWLAAGSGAACVVLIGSVEQGLVLEPADGLLGVAVLLLAIGYAEGGRLAAELDGLRVITWSLLFAAPVTFPLVAWQLWTAGLPSLSLRGGLALGYVSLVSQLLGFCAWYRGLALGGVARGSQVQLAQPILSLLWCALLLGETLSPLLMLGGLIVILCAALARTARR